MAELRLSNGSITIVDDEDFERLRAHRWHCSAFGYATRNELGVGAKGQLRMHREILGVTDPKMLVDHINMNRLDNRKQNLRICTQAQNLCNRPSTRGSSGYKGVTYYAKTGRWCAKIGHNRRSKNLGYYDTPEEAHEVYCLWADMLHGAFAHYGVK